MTLTELVVSDLWDAVLDSSTYLPGANNKVSLVVSPFTPAPNLALASLTLASFAGSAAKTLAATTAAANKIFDSVTGAFGAVNIEPAGGLNFTCTAAPASPQTVYGWIITNSAITVLYASQLLPTPIVVGAIGNFVQLSALLGWLISIPVTDEPQTS